MKVIFNLTFEEAIKACLNNKGFIRGENFKKGVFVNNENGILVAKESTSIGYKKLNNFMITNGTIGQKYRLLVAVTDKALNDEI